MNQTVSLVYVQASPLSFYIQLGVYWLLKMVQLEFFSVFWIVFLVVGKGSKWNSLFSSNVQSQVLSPITGSSSSIILSSLLWSQSKKKPFNEINWFEKPKILTCGDKFQMFNYSKILCWYCFNSGPNCLFSVNTGLNFFISSPLKRKDLWKRFLLMFNWFPSWHQNRNGLEI